jgi:hypothetical protein
MDVFHLWLEKYVKLINWIAFLKIYINPTTENFWSSKDFVLACLKRNASNQRVD